MHMETLGQILNGPQENQVVSVDYTGSKGKLHFLSELPWKMSRAHQVKSSPGRMEKGIHLSPQRHQSPWKCSGTCEVSHSGPIGDTGYPGAAEEDRQDTQQHLTWLEMPEPFPTFWQSRPVWNRSPWQ